MYCFSVEVVNSCDGGDDIVRNCGYVVCIYCDDVMCDCGDVSTRVVCAVVVVVIYHGSECSGGGEAKGHTVR